MKLKYQFAVRNILDEYVLVPIGEGALYFAGMITTSEVGAFLAEALQEETSLQELTAKLTATYDVEADIARRDVEEFVAKLNGLKLLENV